MLSLCPVLFCLRTLMLMANYLPPISRCGGSSFQRSRLSGRSETTNSEYFVHYSSRASEPDIGIASCTARSSIPPNERVFLPISHLAALHRSANIRDLVVTGSRITNVSLSMLPVFYHLHQHWGRKALLPTETELPLMDWVQFQLTVFSSVRWAAPMKKAPIVQSRR